MEKGAPILRLRKFDPDLAVFLWGGTVRAGFFWKKGRKCENSTFFAKIRPFLAVGAGSCLDSRLGFCPKIVEQIQRDFGNFVAPISGASGLYST